MLFEQPKLVYGSRISSFLIAAALAAATLPTLTAAASLDVYLSAPRDQATYIAGAKTENFNSLPSGSQTKPFNSTIGAYEFSSSSRLVGLNADQYGGAYGSRYVSLGAQSGSATPVTLQLTKPATYFGFWWSAGDPNNGLSFYYNDTLLTRLVTADIITILNANNGVVTALNGSHYAKGSYYANPNNGRDAAEPFAYVNIFAKDTGFNKIVFDNSGLTASGFETDNHSVFSGDASPTLASVFVESGPAIHISATPEPNTVALAGLGVFGFALLLRRRKQ